MLLRAPSRSEYRYEVPDAPRATGNRARCTAGERRGGSGRTTIIARFMTVSPFSRAAAEVPRGNADRPRRSRARSRVLPARPAVRFRPRKHRPRDADRRLSGAVRRKRGARPLARERQQLPVELIKLCRPSLLPFDQHLLQFGGVCTQAAWIPRQPRACEAGPPLSQRRSPGPADAWRTAAGRW